MIETKTKEGEGESGLMDDDDDDRKMERQRKDKKIEDTKDDPRESLRDSVSRHSR